SRLLKRSGDLSLWTGRLRRMDDKSKVGLQHTPARAGLSLHSSRSSIIARGRREAASAATDPDYRQGAAEFKAGNFEEAAASFHRMAEQGHAESQYILSTMYEAGQGVVRD